MHISGAERRSSYTLIKILGYPENLAEEKHSSLLCHNVSDEKNIAWTPEYFTIKLLHS